MLARCYRSSRFGRSAILWSLLGDVPCGLRCRTLSMLCDSLLARLVGIAEIAARAMRIYHTSRQVSDGCLTGWVTPCYAAVEATIRFDPLCRSPISRPAISYLALRISVANALTILSM